MGNWKAYRFTLVMEQQIGLPVVPNSSLSDDMLDINLKSLKYLQIHLFEGEVGANKMVSATFVAT